LRSELGQEVGYGKLLRFGEGSQSSVAGQMASTFDKGYDNGGIIGGRDLECGRGKGIGGRWANLCLASGDFPVDGAAPIPAAAAYVHDIGSLLHESG
jgi:hypothetical protein